jgi:hypothetical protein
MSVCSFRNLALTAALPLSLLCAGRAEAISTITQTVTPTTLNAFQDLGFGRLSPRSSSSSFTQDFNKFDTTLGTLVGIRFEGNGNLLGSFRGAKSSDFSPQARLAGGTATLNVNFASAGWSTNNTGGATSFVPGRELLTTTAANIGSQGSLLTSTNPTLNLSGSDTTGTYFSFFEGLAGETISSVFTWGLELASGNLSTTGSCLNNPTITKCTGFNFSPTGLTAGQTPLRGDINEFTLSYDYEPFPPPAPIPAPLPILGSGVAFAYTRRLRRRIQKARITD